MLFVNCDRHFDIILLFNSLAAEIGIVLEKRARSSTPAAERTTGGRNNDIWSLDFTVDFSITSYRLVFSREVEILCVELINFARLKLEIYPNDKATHGFGPTKW